MKKTIKFYTLGCKANQYETQSIREYFLNNGFSEKEGSAKANVYVINTCTVTSKADSQSLNIIRRLRKENPKAKIIVTGCLTELDADKIKQACQVDSIIKNKDKNKISQSISYFKNHTRAFLKVQDGCNYFCSYCKVPLVRGRSQSRDFNQIISEAERLSANGYKEIVLTGICLGSYQDLAKLVSTLEKIPGLLRLRLSSIEPQDIKDDLIKVIKNSSVLCRHLHIPLQSGDDSILKKMRRRYSSKDFLRLVKKIRKNIPGIAITTDCLVGFPGETKENFQNTVKLIKEINPLKVHIFPYSPRPGTQSYLKYKTQVDLEEVKEKCRMLEAVNSNQAKKYLRKFLNKPMDVLIEGKVKGASEFWQGHTSNYIKVLVDSKENLYNKIIKVAPNKLKNECLQAISYKRRAKNAKP
ncbi:MAG: MiaB/RimO family radical SAM methylthiotransferase [Candidatus Omnitrophica bacterium]|jgi:threonylcarbamoyladenosine tRNA methylthiotransferase MtaB|nr:MiaB/RimO family radical SAM methylthiotransferase [Candidatus Omnitrophota bacterium]